MNLIKNFRVVILIVLPILILVLLRSFTGNHFQIDAKKWAEPSVMRSNIITKEQLASITGEKLLINLGKEVTAGNEIIGNIVNISPDSILIKNNLDRIRKHNGPVLLRSSEPAVSARIWMVLSQMGLKNIFILTSDTDNELIKYKFRSDTLVKPEF